MTVTAAANNKFIAVDEVHKLIITGRATHLAAAATAGVPVQTITDDLQHNSTRLTDADSLSRDYSRVFAASANLRTVTCLRPQVATAIPKTREIFLEL